MEDIMIVLINLDSGFLNDNLDYHLLFDYIEKARSLRKIDRSLLIFYSKFEQYSFRKKIKSIEKVRDEYPDVILGRIYSKNNGFITSIFYKKADENKKFLFDSIIKKYSEFIDVDAILVLDDDLKLESKSLDNIFGDREVITRSFIPTEDNKVLKRTIS